MREQRLQYILLGGTEGGEIKKLNTEGFNSLQPETATMLLLFCYYFFFLETRKTTMSFFGDTKLVKINLLHAFNKL